MMRSLTLAALLLLSAAALSQTADEKQCPMHKQHQSTAASAPAQTQAPPPAPAAEDQRARYLRGEGMGMARPAEMNHYPGPRHVLDVADQLALTPDQRKQTQSLYDAMHEQAVALGSELVKAEDELTALFRDQRASADEVQRLSMEIAHLQGRLRATHLSTHIRERAVLTAAQIATYDSLRNYSPGDKPAPVHQH